MRTHWMHLAVIATVLSLVAGCAAAQPAQPSPAQPTPTQAPPTQAPATLAPATQPPTTAPSPASSSAAPSADMLAVVKAFEDAYNRHDVDATAGLLRKMACMDWGSGPQCGVSRFKDLLRYDAALNSQLEISDCTVKGESVTCKATRRDDCLVASGAGDTHYAPVVFRIQDGKLSFIAATRVPEEAQQDLMFLYSLAGWAHRIRPTEWDEAGRWDLLEGAYPATFNSRTGAVMSTLCKEYALVAAAATTPSPAPAPPKMPPPPRAPGSVLFIGDSSSLGLDGLLPKLAASAQPSVTVASKLNWHPDVAFAGQYELGTALDDIRQGKWDVVVLQDDLNADWPGRAAEFTEYGRRFDQAIKQAGGETVFYMIYPYSDSKETTTEEINAAYSKIGQELGDKVAPVALAFQRSLRERPDLNLYADTDLPNSMGTYLIGCVLYATIFGRSPIGLAYDRPGEGIGEWQISEKDAADLQRIAWETVQDYQAGR